MSTASPPPIGLPPNHLRFKVFIDFWNLQLGLNRHECQATGQRDSKFLIDWLKLPDCLVVEAVRIVRAPSYSYEGSIVYTSYNPKTAEERKYRNWLETWLDRQPGIQVKCRERSFKGHPTCPVCHKTIARCPHDDCGKDLARTVEKGVDTAIATDMIRLAWEKAYDVGILATSDADLIPAVEFLDQKGVRILQAGFPPTGIDLARACWATINVPAIRDAFRRGS